MTSAVNSATSSHGASSGRFAFLADAVSRVVEEQAVSTDASYLSERSLRKLEDPYTAVQSMMGVTAFAAYGTVPGLMLTGPNGQILQLSVDEWAKAWSISKSTTWNESYWKKLCTTLDLAKLAAPMKLAILSRLLPAKQALIVQEGCLAHLESILKWKTIDIHSCESDENRRAAAISSMKTWLASCYEALQEISKKLDADFVVNDSSLALQHWVELEPAGTTWSDYCHQEKLRCSQVENIDFTSTGGWTLRRDRLLRSISQFHVLKDTGMRGQLLPKLRVTKSINDFHATIELMSKDFRFPSVDEFLGICSAKPVIGPLTTLCKHFQKHGTCKYGDACKYSHQTSSSTSISHKSEASPPYTVANRRHSMPDIHTAPESVPVKPEDTKSTDQVKSDPGVCHYFEKHRTCKFGEACKFQHLPQPPATAVTQDDDEPRRSERLRHKDTKTVGAVSPVHSVVNSSDEVCTTVLEIGGQEHDCVVDSGAAVSLVALDAVGDSEAHQCDQVRAIRGVGGGELAVHSIASIPVRGPNGFADINFFVVDCLPYKHEFLRGWKDMEKLGLSVSFGGQGPSGNNTVGPEPPTLPDCAEGPTQDGLSILLSAEASVADECEICVSKARELLVERGREWSPLPAAEDYQGRVRELLPEEKRDLPNQTHTVEIRWDAKDPPVANTGDFSVRMLSKLTEEQRSSFANECQKFISNGWWVKSSDLKEEQGPAGVSFPRFQGAWKSTSTRAVIDLKRWNSTRPKASWDGQPCTALVMSWRGRCSSTDTTVFLDLSKAYYKNRLKVNEVGWIFIKCFGELYRTDRAAFGAGFGSAAMTFGVRLLMTAVCMAIQLFLGEPRNPRLPDLAPPATTPSDVQLSLAKHGINWLDFLDDVLVFGSLRMIALLTLCMRLTAACIGYEFPLSKIDVTSEETASNQGAAPRHLGLLWTTAGACCVDIRHQLRAEVPEATEARMSKADLYRVAGLLQDVCRCHGERRYLADLIRRFGGRLPKKTPHPKADWRAKNLLSAKETTTLSLWIKAAVDTYAEGCCHAPTGDKGQTIILYTDASSIGYGWALWRGSGLPTLDEDQPHNVEALKGLGYELLEEDAKHFSGSRGEDWHVNRKELAGVASGLSAVYQWVFQRQLSEGAIKELFVLGDNVSALKWAGIPDKPIKSFDVAGIRNLQSSLAELRVSLVQAGISVHFRHVQGKCNVIADRLSRLGILFPLRPVATDQSTTISQLPLVGVALEVSGELLHMVEAATACDTTIPTGLEAGTVKGRSVLRRGGAIYIPESCRQRVLALAHSGNHLSGRRTVGAIANLAWWPSWRRDAKEWVKKCARCAREAASIQTDKLEGKLSSHFATERFSEVYIDACRPDVGLTVFLIVDNFSRWVEPYITEDASSKCAVEALVLWCARFGCPRSVRCDQGSHFVAETFKHYCESNNIELSFGSPYNPMRQGLVEKQVGELKKGLRKLGRWDAVAVSLVFSASNNSDIGDTGFTPHELVFGEAGRSALWQALADDAEEANMWCRMDVKDYCQSLAALLKEQDEEWARVQKEYRQGQADRKPTDTIIPLKENDLVWWIRDDDKIRGRIAQGPYAVIGPVLADPTGDVDSNGPPATYRLAGGRIIPRHRLVKYLDASDISGYPELLGGAGLVPIDMRCGDSSKLRVGDLVAWVTEEMAEDEPRVTWSIDLGLLHKEVSNEEWQVRRLYYNPETLKWVDVGSKKVDILHKRVPELITGLALRRDRRLTRKSRDRLVSAGYFCS